MSILDRYVRPGQPARAPSNDTGGGMPTASATRLGMPTASAIGQDGYALDFPKGGFEYQACDAPAEQQPHFLVILRREHGHICPSYGLLEQVDFDGGGTWILLDFGSEVINVKGRNLHPVVVPLLNKTAELIREYQPGKYAPLTDDRPIITQIETHNTRPATRNEVKALTDRIARLEQLLEKVGGVGA